MTLMIVVSTYLLIGVITGRLAVYTLSIKKDGLTGEDFIFLPLVSILWFFSIWFVGFFAIEHWWNEREKGKGRPQWVVDAYTSVFGIK